jgi:hypothetical protein
LGEKAATIHGGRTPEGGFYGRGSADLRGEKLGSGKTRLFKGFFAKMMSKHRVFDGQFVVRCVVNVVLLTARFES